MAGPWWPPAAGAMWLHVNHKRWFTMQLRTRIRHLLYCEMGSTVAVEFVVYCTKLDGHAFTSTVVSLNKGLLYYMNLESKFWTSPLKCINPLSCRWDYLLFSEMTVDGIVWVSMSCRAWLTQALRNGTFRCRLPHKAAASGQFDNVVPYNSSD